MSSPSSLALLSLVLSLPLSEAFAQSSPPPIVTVGLSPAGCPVNFSAERKSYSAFSPANSPQRQFPAQPGSVGDFDGELNRATLQRQQDAVSLAGLQQRGASVAEVTQAQQRLQADDSNLQAIQQRIDRTIPKAAAAQGVQLTFTQSDASKISKAAVTVHGTSSRLQTITAATDAPKDSWTESFLIERSEGASALPTRSLRTRALATSNWVEITEIDFVDGTVWKKQPGAQCVLVAGD